ncbi:MAG: hypothetical protein WCA29_06205 [Jiangellales bacterium]
MSERMPVEGAVGEAALSSPWTCPRCGRDNKATWNQCPGCESDRAGLTPVERTPVRKTRRTNPVNLILGLLILVALVVLAVNVAEPVWEWVGEQWGSFTAWLDARL